METQSTEAQPIQSRSTLTGKSPKKIRHKHLLSLKKRHLKPEPRKPDLSINPEVLQVLLANGISVSNKIPIYDLEKSSAGFRQSELKRIDLIGAWAILNMKQPMGFHLIVYPDTEKLDVPSLLKNLPKLLKRFGIKHQGPGFRVEVLFIYKVERSRGDGIHIHLYCVVDGWKKYSIETLIHTLQERLESKVKLVRRLPIPTGKSRDTYDDETGELIKHEKLSKKYLWHLLKLDFEDWRTRTSYAAKNLTRLDIGEFKSFHCSRPKIRFLTPNASDLTLISATENGQKINDIRCERVILEQQGEEV